MRCLDCKFSEMQDLNPNVKFLVCRRFPPSHGFEVAYPNKTLRFTAVKPGWWCGEFKSKQEVSEIPDKKKRVRPAPSDAA